MGPKPTRAWVGRSPELLSSGTDPDLSATAPADRALGAYLLLSALALAFPYRPAGWAGVLGGHLVSAGVLLCAPLRNGALRPLRAGLPALWGFLRVWYPVLLIPLLYAEIPLLNRAVHGGRYFDALVLRWERALFGGLPSRSWARDLPISWLSELLHGAYLAYYPLIFAPPLILWLQRRTHAARTAIFVFVLVSVVHYLFFVFFPVQGPRYLFPPPAARGIDRGALYGLTHRVLDAGSSRGTAFPSGHVAVAVAQTLVCARFLPRHVPAYAVLALALAAGTVYGGFHYLVDALAGGLVGLVVALAGLRFFRGRCVHGTRPGKAPDSLVVAEGRT